MVLTKQFIIDVEEVIVASLKKESVIKELSKSIANCLYKKFEHEFSEIRQEMSDIKQEFKEFKEQAILNEKTYKQKLNMLEQQSREKNIAVFGFKERNGENLKKDVIEFFNKSKLETNLTLTDIDRCSRVGKRINNSKPRPIIIKFINYQNKIDIFKIKKNLKGTGITIKEDLTQDNLKLYNIAAQKYGHANAWTKNGVVYVKTQDGITLYRENQQLGIAENNGN